MGKIDTNYGHGRYKGIIYDYDAVREESEDSCLFCLTKQQAAFLLSSLEPARWLTRWISPTDTPIDQDWLDAWVSDLELKLMTDYCDIGSQIDSIVKYIQDLSAHCQELEEMVCLQSTKDLAYYQGLLTAGGDPIGAPQPSFYHDNGDLTAAQAYARDNAMCAAIHRYIYTIALEQETAAAVATGVVTAALSIWGTPILGAIAGTLGGILIADLQAAIGDTTAVDKVACCMAAGLNGNMSQALFQHSLDSCGFTFGTNEAVVAGAVGPNNAFPVNYRAFQSILAEENAKATAAGVSSFSSCTSCAVCSGEVNFGKGAVQGVIIKSGTLVNGTSGMTGLVGTKITNSGTGQLSSDFYAEILFATPCHMVNAYTEFFQDTAYVGGGQGLTIEFYTGSPGSYSLAFTWGPAHVTGENHDSIVPISGGPFNVTRIIYRPTYFSSQSDLRSPIAIHCIGWS